MTSLQLNELIVRVPGNVAVKDQKWSLLKFNGSLNVDISRWSNTSLSVEREDNEATFNPVDKGPKIGVGSEFGKIWREEARRKKMGYSSAQYTKDNQPWILTQNADSTDAKKFRGIKEGGVSQNADYWVLVRAGEKLFEAYPVDELYNFTPIGRYKTLDAEEAEEKFSNRNKILNQFAIRIRQQLEGTESSENGPSTSKKREEEDENVSSKDKKKNDSDDEDVKPTKSTKVRKKKALSKKDRIRPSVEDGEDQIASADSDDGDSEGREVDYMSDSELSFTSEEEPEDEKVRKALVGVDEEVGMKKLIESDQEDEQAEENEDEENEEEEGKKKFDVKADAVPTVGVDRDEGASDSGSDSDDFDEDIKAPFFMQEIKASNSAETSSGPSDASGGKDGGLKRKALGESDFAPTKKIKTERAKSGETNGITLEEVRLYLQRKPQSSKDLVAKFKPKCQGMSKAEVVKYLADVLKRLAPEQTQRNGTMYFFMKK